MSMGPQELNQIRELLDQGVPLDEAIRSLQFPSSGPPMDRGYDEARASVGFGMNPTADRILGGAPPTNPVSLGTRPGDDFASQLRSLGGALNRMLEPRDMSAIRNQGYRNRGRGQEGPRLERGSTRRPGQVVEDPMGLGEALKNINRPEVGDPKRGPRGRKVGTWTAEEIEAEFGGGPVSLEERLAPEPNRAQEALDELLSTTPTVTPLTGAEAEATAAEAAAAAEADSSEEALPEAGAITPLPPEGEPYDELPTTTPEEVSGPGMPEEKKGSLAGRLLRGAGKSGLLADVGVLLGAAVGGEGVRRGVEKGLEVQRQEKRFERGMTFREEQLAQTKALTEARLKIMEEGNKNDAMRIMAQVRASAGKADATAQGKIADRLWDLTKAAAGGEMNREDCIAAIRKETELRGVKWTQEMEAKYDSYFAPYLMRVDDRISPVQSNDMVKAAELQERAARIKVRLRNPELQPLLGAVQGRINEFKSWIFGADPDVVPPEFSKLLTEMGFEVDAVRREATGAAINSSEEKFYNMLVGSLSMDYRALSNQMDIIMDTMQDFRVSPLKRALGAKYSWAGDDYEDALSQLPTFTYQGWLKGTIAAARGGDERSQRLLRDAGIIGGQ